MSSSSAADDSSNLDRRTVEGFGHEWSTFDQRSLKAEELRALFRAYFKIFPWHSLGPGANGFDMGCGSGRWARLVAPRVGRLHCIDASETALAVARAALVDHPNCVFHRASVEEVDLPDASMDFGYSLGVLHHIPNPQRGLDACARLLRPGAPFLVYLYYALENRPTWYRALWRLSDAVRSVVSHRGHRTKLIVSTAVAALIYVPLSRLARVSEAVGLRAEDVPLAYYRRRSFFTMRTDAYDRLATRLERRFTRPEIAAMLVAAGFADVRFSDSPPYWCALARRTDAVVAASKPPRISPGEAEGTPGDRSFTRPTRR